MGKCENPVGARLVRTKSDSTPGKDLRYCNNIGSNVSLPSIQKPTPLGEAQTNTLASVRSHRDRASCRKVKRIDTVAQSEMHEGKDGV